jgi:L-asparaginase
MEYKSQAAVPPKVRPRLIIHGGAGNIQPANLTPDKYAANRASLLTIVSNQKLRYSQKKRTHLPQPSNGLPSVPSHFPLPR